METNFNTASMDEMKRQFSLLQQKLDNQEIVNKRLLQKTMKANASKLNGRARKNILAGIIVIPFSTFLFHRYGFSSAFIIATIVLLIFCVEEHIRYHYKFWSMNLSDRNMLEAGREISRLRRKYHNWTKYFFPIILGLWLIWFEVEGLYFGHNLYFALGGLVGAIIGAVVGLKTNRDTQALIEELES